MKGTSISSFSPEGNKNKNCCFFIFMSERILRKNVKIMKLPSQIFLGMYVELSTCPTNIKVTAVTTNGIDDHLLPSDLGDDPGALQFFISTRALHD